MVASRSSMDLRLGIWAIDSRASHNYCNDFMEFKKDSHQEKKNLCPECPDALDTLDALDATCLTRTQFAIAPCIQTQLATASAYRTERVRAFSFWTQPCQGIFLLDAAVSGQMASGRRVSWYHGHAGCQGTEHCSKYSRRIRKHAAGSRHSDSVQFYSLYLMYIYICYYHTSRGNKGKLANMTRCIEYDAMSTMR